MVYEHIMEVFAMDNSLPLHVDGRTGRGQTYVLYPVIGALWKLNEIVLLSASSSFGPNVVVPILTLVIFL
jgi:hypothetical protein